MTIPKLLAVDPSLTSTGWALFEVSEERPKDVGIISPPGPSMPMTKRLSDLQLQVVELYNELSLGEGDYLVCEGPAQLVLNPQSSLKVERVRGVFESVARTKDILIPGRLNPRTVQHELLGMRGKQLPRDEVKRWARATSEQLFGDLLERIFNERCPDKRSLPQDVVDAALIGVLATAKVKLCGGDFSSLVSAFAAGSSKRNSRNGVRW